MIEADIEESKRLRGKIAAETKTASKKRRDELEAMYEPIMENLPEKRQKEIENEVKEVSQDSRDFFLDVWKLKRLTKHFDKLKDWYFY